MLAIVKESPTNEVAAHWAHKLHNRKSKRFAFLDSGATSGAAPEEEEPDLEDTGQPSKKTFMFPHGCTRKATKEMLLKHNLQLAAREMNIVPGLHSAPVSIPKLVDTGYTPVFNKMVRLLMMTRLQLSLLQQQPTLPGLRTLQTHRNQPQGCLPHDAHDVL